MEATKSIKFNMFHGWGGCKLPFINKRGWISMNESLDLTICIL
jgi:hypothetical protein